jgi:hypothetical protein
MGLEAAPALLVIATDIDPAYEAPVNLWYDARHVPQRRALPGFRSANRYIADEGSPKYALLYDLDSPEALQTEAYRALSRPPEQTDEDREMLKRFSNTMRGVMTEICRAGAVDSPAPEKAGALLLVGLEPEPAYEEEYNAWYDEEHIPYIIEVPGVLRVRRFRAVDGGLGYLTVWDFANSEVRHTPAFAKAAETPWTRRMRAHCKRTITTIYRPLVPNAIPTATQRS